MKALKISLYAVGALVLLVAIAFAAFAALFDANRFRADVERIVKEHGQRTLKLEGDVKLAFFPSIGVSLGKATLSERNSEREFASIESAHVSVALMPLFSARVLVDAVRLSGLRAGVIRRRDGQTNVDDLLGVPAPEAEKPAGEPARMKFDISGVRVERSSLVWRDEKSGQELAVSDLDLTTGRIASEVPGRIEFSAAIKGRNPAADASVKLAGGYLFNLERKVFSLSKLDGRVRGSLAGLHGLDAGLKGDLAASLEKGEFSASNLSLDAKGGLGKGRFEARLSAPKLALTGGKASDASLSADFRFKTEDRSLDAKLQLSGIEGSAKLVSVTSLVLDLTLASPALPQKTLGLPIRGSLRADFARRTAAADVSTRFDESSIQAKLGVTRFAPLATSFDIAIDRLNLDKYLPPRSEGAKKPVPKAGEAPIDLAALKTLNTSGRIAIGALTLSRVRLASVKADVRAAGGRLEIGPHSASLYEGTLAGALAVHADGNRIVARENLANVAIGPLLRDLTGKDAIDGKGNIALDITTSGPTVSAMKRALAGTARVQLVNGAVKGINLAETLRRTKAALGSRTAQQQAARGAEQTDFSELSANFAIRSGVARNDDLQAKAPLFRLSGAGDIDIGNSQLNYLAKAAVVATTKGQGGADLAHVAGLTVPVRLTGPFEAPRYEIDYAAVLAGAATEKAREAVGGAVREKLKRLFGR